MIYSFVYVSKLTHLWTCEWFYFLAICVKAFHLLGIKRYSLGIFKKLRYFVTWSILWWVPKKLFHSIFLNRRTKSEKQYKIQKKKKNLLSQEQKRELRQEGKKMMSWENIMVVFAGRSFDVLELEWWSQVGHKRQLPLPNDPLPPISLLIT